MQVFDQDLKEAISDVKTNEYWRELKSARSSVALSAIEHRIRMDFQLTGNDRLQLLAEVEHADALAG